MAGLATLPADAERLLILFVAELETLGVDVPARRGVVPGPRIAWDAEQLVVSLQGVESGQPGAYVSNVIPPQIRVFTATFAVDLLRETPALADDADVDSMLPAVEDLQVSAGQLIDDAAALAQAAVAIASGYLMTEPGVGFAIGPVVALAPAGGIAGSRVQVEMSLT